MTWPLGEGIVSVLAKSTNTFLRITYGLARMPPGHFFASKVAMWRMRSCAAECQYPWLLQERRRCPL